MERNISPAAILCIVLVSLACVIGIGYGVFAITKGSANEGTQEVASQTSYASNSWKDDYDAKDVTGAQVQNLLNEAESKGIAVFVNTRGMCQGTIKTQSEVPVLKHNGKYYMNYGTVFDYEDESYKKASGEVSMSGNSNLLGVRDGSSLKVDANPKLQDGKLVRNKDYTGLYANGAVNYIDTHAKFRSNLVYGNNGEVVGVILSQVNRAGATLSLSSGGGFTNGSAGMGGTSGSYIPSHSGGGNIPLTGGTVGGGSSSSGGSSVATPGSGANASGPSTKPSEPAPSVSSGEVVVTFDTRGGNVIDYQKLTSGFKVTKPTAPTRAGYGFAGWYTDENCSSKYNFDSAVSKNITLYARWLLWGDINGNGSLTKDDAIMVKDWYMGILNVIPLYVAGFVRTDFDKTENLSLSDYATIMRKVRGAIQNFEVESRTSGYEFDFESGYYYTTSNEKKPIPVGIRDCNITFMQMEEGGWNTYKVVTCKPNTSVSKPTDPVRDGYSFGGWYLDEDCTNSFDFSSKLTTSFNLYPKWVSLGEKIPSGGTYYVGDTEEWLGHYSSATAVYHAGDYFPITVNTGDIYVCGDYEYRYNYSSNGGGGWYVDVSHHGRGAKIIDTEKTEYEPALASINGKPVNDLSFTYCYCYNLETSPKLSEGVVYMKGTFLECYDLKELPVLPSTVKDLYGAFMCCEQITEPCVIPQGVENMDSAFTMCTELLTPPVIPSSVTNIYCVVGYCTKMVGSIEINSNPTNYTAALIDTKITSVIGSTNLKSEILATKNS